VAVTNNSYKPIIKYEGIEISTGQVTNIGITRTFYSKLPKPYGNCRSDVETPSTGDSVYYKYTVLLGKYTRNLCFEVCFQYKYAIAKCKCADPSINSNVNSVTVCTYDNLSCLSERRQEFSSSNCEIECPEACDRIDYSYRVSTSYYPTR
jgi:hypothetical protein